MQSIRPLDPELARCHWPHIDLWIQPGRAVTLGRHVLMTLFCDRLDNGTREYHLSIERCTGTEQVALLPGVPVSLLDIDTAICRMGTDPKCGAVRLRFFEARHAALHLH